MALIQRYATDFTSDVAVHRSRRDGRPIEDELAAIQRNDDNEKRYLTSLNNRLEELLRHFDGLEGNHRQLRDQLNRLIGNWGLEIDRERMLKEIDQSTRNLSAQHRRKVQLDAETKLFNEQAHLTDRVTGIFQDVINFYRDQCEIFFELIPEFEDELRRIEGRWKISEDLMKSLDNEYQKELKKFRQYLNEWSRIVLEKQILLNQIQSLREQFNLRLAFNQEELNEWRRLLTRASHESKNFYRDYLDTIKQQLQLDYQQMIKDQQRDLDFELRSKLKEIEEQFQIASKANETERKNRLIDRTKEFQRYENEYRRLNEENQRKRRVLKDLENERRNKERRHAENNDRLRRDRDLLRAQYHLLRDQLDQLANKLKLGVEDELRIYETLINSYRKQTESRTVKKSTANALPTRTATKDRNDMSQSLIDRLASERNEKRTIKRLSQLKKNQTVSRYQQQKSFPELDENYIQSKVHITRKYKGNILIKFVDVTGRFVEIENTGGQSRDLTGWCVERTVDGERIRYTFPSFQLNGRQSVRIYGNADQTDSRISLDDSYLTLIAPNLSSWGIGRRMRTELFNRENVGKALFEQTIRD